jgi:hypothetical protein
MTVELLVLAAAWLGGCFAIAAGMILAARILAKRPPISIHFPMPVTTDGDPETSASDHGDEATFATPRLDYPRSSDGKPVEPTGVEIDAETALHPGMRVLAQSQNRWWRAVVNEVLPDGRVRVRFLGWDSKWDEILVRERLQVDLRLYELDES